MPRLLATYRIQFHRGFTFRDAQGLVPYLDALGVSHVYASPYFKARAQSTHGYDIVDHNALNPELGEEADFDAFIDCLRRHDMGHILDFVPNHMGIGKAQNAWWLDVLEWGRASPHAGFFDIDWEPSKPGLRGKVLLPFLGDHYGAVLERGELRLAFDPQQGAFGVRYHDHRFPISPRRYARILSHGMDALRAASAGDAAVGELDALIAGFRSLGREDPSLRRRAAARETGERLKRELSRLALKAPRIGAFIDEAVAAFNGTAGNAESFRPLHRLLEVQPYRLAYWRVAADEINYRRFFDINDLVGLNMERTDLFELAHRLVFRLIAEGKVQGLRIDHIDGLNDPRRYCALLQSRAGALAGRAQGEGGGARQPEAGEGAERFYLVVEKILASHEGLRDEWAVAGTTGYEFLNQLNGLYVDSRGEGTLTRVYQRFVGREIDFEDVLYASKKHVMDNLLASELNVLANQLDRIAEGNWRTRDFTLNSLREALREVIACFPVYRTYVTVQGAGADDRRDIGWAVNRARRLSPAPDRTVFDFIHAVLTTDLVRRRRSGYSRRRVIAFAMKVQQYTAPVMAKALEDTSFYRHHRLVSLNEVGGDPRRFGTSVAAFHRANQERARKWPQTMLATSTHDSKRGEDVRQRINVLSELAEDWGGRCRRWARLNCSKKRREDGEAAPTANDEYLLYQTLLGAWPMDLMDQDRPDAAAMGRFVERMQAYMVKAVREGKNESSWTNPNETYEDAVRAFVHGILDVSRPNPFLAEFLPLQKRVAMIGMLNGLSQTLLKLTAPGVPDIYQGCELWDLRLVDPDNRRAVDYRRRRRLLDEIVERFQADAGDAPAKVRALLDGWRDGRVKLYLISKLLDLRKKHAELFLRGTYEPLHIKGVHADHLCAFLRQHRDARLMVAAPRLTAKLSGEAGEPPLAADVWGDTAVLCPAVMFRSPLYNVLTGETVGPLVRGGEGEIPAAVLLANFPGAALISANVG